MNINEIKNLDPFDSLLEGVTDMPEGATPEQQIDLLMQRLTIAKKMLGYANKLATPEEKKKHRSRIMGFMNQMRPMLKKLIDQIGSEQEGSKLSENNNQKNYENNIDEFVHWIGKHVGVNNIKQLMRIQGEVCDFKTYSGMPVLYYEGDGGTYYGGIRNGEIATTAILRDEMNGVLETEHKGKTYKLQWDTGRTGEEDLGGKSILSVKTGKRPSNLGHSTAKDAYDNDEHPMDVVTNVAKEFGKYNTTGWTVIAENKEHEVVLGILLDILFDNINPRV